MSLLSTKRTREEHFEIGDFQLPPPGSFFFCFNKWPYWDQWPCMVCMCVCFVRGEEKNRSFKHLAAVKNKKRRRWTSRATLVPFGFCCPFKHCRIHHISPSRERCVSFVLTMFVWCVFLPQRLPSVAPIAQRSRGSNRAAYLKKAYALSSRRREGGGQIDGWNLRRRRRHFLMNLKRQSP